MLIVVIRGGEGAGGRRVDGETSSFDSLAGVSELGAGSGGWGGFSGEVAAATASSTGGAADIVSITIGGKPEGRRWKITKLTWNYDCALTLYSGQAF